MTTTANHHTRITSQGKPRIPGEGAHNAKGPVSDERWIPSVCSMCYNSCTIQVLVRDGVATAIEGLPGAPHNYGKMCAKGKAALSGLYSGARVTRPLRRTNPEKGLNVDPMWEEISWEEAMNIITDRVKDIRENNPGGLSIQTFDLSSASTVSSAFETACGGGRRAATTVPSGVNLFCGRGVHPVALMVNGSSDKQPDFKYTKYLIVFGGGFGTGTGTHAMAFARELADARVERGLKTVVVDPCKTSSGGRADEWIPIVPGTDSAMALSMAHVLVNELGLYDQAFLRSYTNSTYLIRPDGHYARDPQSKKPLVLSLSREVPLPYDEVEPDDMALEGESSAGGEQVRTAFSLLREHLGKYTPEFAERVTTVPAHAIRRIAREFGTAARIGATVEVEKATLPLRPACVVWYRGLGQHQHGLHNGWSAAMLNTLVGAVDVPGGYCGTEHSGPWGIPVEGQDGLIMPGNPHSASWRPSLPVKEAKFDPEDPSMTGMFPVTIMTSIMGGLTLRTPEKFKARPNLEFWIHCRGNPMKSAGSPEETAEILKKIPFQLSLVQHHEETSEFADIILPDTHYLERTLPFALDSYRSFMHSPSPYDQEWAFALQQPVVEPIGEARNWVEVLWELAHRAGLQDDFYAALNASLRLSSENQLKGERTYTFEEFCDLWMREWCGNDQGLEYFKEHGWGTAPLKREVMHRYPRAFHTGRIPLYLEHWLTAGESVRRVVVENQIEWGDISDYEPLVNYKPCQASLEGGEEFPLYLQSPKTGFLTLNTSTIKNPHLQEISHAMGEVFNLGIHPWAAERYGVKSGDVVELQSANGMKVTIEARVTRDVHPYVVSAPGNVSKVLSPNEKELAGEGVHLNGFLSYDLKRIDMVSGALDSCVKVRLNRVKEREKAPLG